MTAALTPDGPGVAGSAAHLAQREAAARQRGREKTLRDAGARYHYAGVWTVVLRFSRGYPYLAPLITVTSNIDHAFLIDRSGGG